MTRTYAVLFGRGFTIVFLTACNAFQIAHEHYVGAGIVGFLISFVWWFNARTSARSDVAYAGLTYAFGAATGTVAGMASAIHFYHWMYP